MSPFNTARFESRACIMKSIAGALRMTVCMVHSAQGSHFWALRVQDCYLAYFLTELAGATFMVFTRTCDNTRKLALTLRNLGFDALPIHGQMSQPKRLAALNKFKGGERSILVATGAATAHACHLCLTFVVSATQCTRHSLCPFAWPSANMAFLHASVDLYSVKSLLCAVWWLLRIMMHDIPRPCWCC